MYHQPNTLNEPPKLYPLYSDIENSDIENPNPPSNNNKLTVPTPIQRRRNLRNSSAHISRNYQYYKRMMQRRINRRNNNRLYTNTNTPTHPTNPTNPTNPPLSPTPIPYAPNTNNSVYKYNLHYKHNNNRINNTHTHTTPIHHTPLQIPFTPTHTPKTITRRHITRTPPNPMPMPMPNAPKRNIINTKRRSHKKCKPKRRIRTFYSKKWGNKLYGLTKPYPIITNSTITNPTHSTIPNMSITQNAMPIPIAPITNERSPSPQPYLQRHFIEEETLDLNDIKSIRSQSPNNIPIPIPMHHLNIDYFDKNYDSAISNIAANTHTDYENCGSGSGSGSGSSASSGSETELETDIENDRDISNANINKFKIIISSPNNINTMDDNIAINNYNNIMLNRRRRRRRMRRKIKYLSSDASEDSASEYFSSDTDDENTDGNCGAFDIGDCGTGAGLFLANNNMNIGVYSDFNYSDQSDTDYLSAQSGDFDELTICYHNEKKNIRAKNIRFRDNYLSDLGPSDIGSSDTDYFSSADSIPSSLPDTIPDEIIQMGKSI